MLISRLSNSIKTWGQADRTWKSSIHGIRLSSTFHYASKLTHYWYQLHFSWIWNHENYFNPWIIRPRIQFINHTYFFCFQDFHRNFVAISRFNQALPVAMSSLVRNPARLFGIIGFIFELDFKLLWNKQPWRWIWVRSVTLFYVARHVTAYSRTFNKKYIFINDYLCTNS